MSRIFDEAGKVTPITLIEMGELEVTKAEKDEKTGKTLVSIKGKKNPTDKKFINRIVTLDTDKEYKKGDKITIEIFSDSENVDTTSISKGKGFAGTIKRHHFHRGPVSHGSHNVRQPGSIGSMFPQRVIKGRKMPGHLGAGRVTIKSLKVVEIDKDKNILVVKGCVPGVRNALVEVKG